MALTIKNLNAEIISYVTSFTPEEGKYILCGYLEFDVNQLKDLRICIIVEFLRDQLFFCYERSFDVNLILKLLELANELLLRILEDSLVDLLKFYQQEILKLSKNTDKATTNHLKMHMKFIQLEFFQNFKLYQYFMQHSQADYYRCLHLRIDQPPLLPPLSDATESSVFNYVVEVGRLDAEAEDMQRTAEMLKMQAKQRKDGELCIVYSDLLSMPDTCQRETEIEKAINDVATIQLTALSTKLMINITDIKNDIECKIKKLELPVPPSLKKPKPVEQVKIEVKAGEKKSARK